MTAAGKRLWQKLKSQAGRINRAFLQALEKWQNKTPARDILLAPGECFYCQSFELPEAIADEELEAFAELSLEGVSPFPIEHLAWGYLRHPGARRILVYAAHKERLNQLGLGPLESRRQVFPSFITLFGERFETPTVRFLAAGRTLSALLYPASSPVPEQVASIRVGEEQEQEENRQRDPEAPPPDKAVRESRKQLLDQLKPGDRKVEAGWWRAEGRRTGKNGQALFLHHHAGGPDEAPPEGRALPFDERTVWEADIRPRAFKNKQYKNRIYSRHVWRGAMAAAAAGGLLLVLQAGAFGLRLWTGIRENKAALQKEEVKRIEDQRDLLFKLEQFAQHEIKPFKMLAAVNNVRPPDIYFKKVHSRAYNEMSVDGQADNVSGVNNYAEALENNPLITGAKVTSIQSRGGRTTFTMRVAFADTILAPEKPENTGNPPPPEAAGEDQEEKPGPGNETAKRKKKAPGQPEQPETSEETPPRSAPEPLTTGKEARREKDTPRSQNPKPPMPDSQ